MTKKNKKKNKTKNTSKNPVELNGDSNGTNGTCEVNCLDSSENLLCQLCGAAGAVSSSDNKSVILCQICLVRHNHAGKCLPWTIQENGEDKQLVATRTIKPLEVVVVDIAVVTAPIAKVCNHEN